MSAAAGPLDPVADPPARVSLVNIANGLTMVRLLLVPLFAALLLADDGHGHRVWATVVFAIASYTDWVDGQLARRWGLVTSFGKLADPIADKALTGAALIGLSLLGELPWAVTLVVAVREVGITLLRFLVIRHGVIAASSGGKLKTLLQGMAIGLYVLPLDGWLGTARAWVMALAVVVTVVTGLDYVVRAAQLRRTSPRAARKRAAAAARRRA